MDRERMLRTLEDVLTFGSHKPDCAKEMDPDVTNAAECTCGFDAVKAAAEKQVVVLKQEIAEIANEV